MPLYCKDNLYLGGPRTVRVRYNRIVVLSVVLTTYTGTTTGPPRPLRPNNTRLSRSRYINGFSIYPIWLCNRHLSTFAPLNAAPFGQSVLLDSRTRLRNSDCCSLGTECVSVSLCVV
ncbi:hypothetical protein J6590_022409 [Homalodisca vitripennis]|nr:hypothetical protein J6590_022409 [Homalodisca vitripennis]